MSPYAGNAIEFKASQGRVAGRVGPTYLNDEEAARALLKAGFSDNDSVIALAVMKEESWLSPDAEGDLLIQDSEYGPSIGVMQIRSRKDKANGRDAAKLKDVAYNLEHAYALFRIRGWKPWGAFTSGRYKQHLAWANEVFANLPASGKTSDPGKSEGAHVASRGSEQWWFEHWGQPCKGPRSKVTIGGHVFTVDARSVPAFKAWEQVRAKHGYVLHPPYPEGDSGTGNCRHIGNDSNRPWSSHAWWAGIDANWQTNPDGSRLKTDVPKAMRDDLQALRTKKTGAFVWRWGGDWDRDPRTGHSYYDAMHWEIHATPSELTEGIAGTEEDILAAVTREEFDELKADVKRILDVVEETVSVDGVKKRADGIKLIWQKVQAIATKVGA